MRPRDYRRGWWVTPGESVGAIVGPKVQVMQPKSLGSGRLFFGAAWAAVVLGCSPTTTTPKIASPYQGAVVRVACPDEATAALIAVSAPAWANRCQAQVETTTYTLPQGLDGVADADVWVIRPAAMPFWAAAGRLVPAPKESTAAESGSGWTGLLPLYRDRLLLWDRTAYALPVRGEAPVCFYRSDLLGDAGRRRGLRGEVPSQARPPADLGRVRRYRGVLSRRTFRAGAQPAAAAARRRCAGARVLRRRRLLRPLSRPHGRAGRPGAGR